MEKDNDYTEKLLSEGGDAKSKPFSTEYFKDLFGNQNINEGHSTAKYLKLGKAAFIKGVRANIETGLNGDDAEDLKRRRAEYGSNDRKEAVVLTLFDFIIGSLEDPMLRILILASIVSTVIGILQEGLSTGWIEGASIFLAVFIVVSISSFQNYSKDQQFRKLEEENAKKDVRVRRNGINVVEIPVEQLVVGDILHLDIGDIVPADGLLIKDSTTMDESAMTGESDLAKKVCNEKEMSHKVNPFIISGTQVMDGSGEMVVLAVGENKVAGMNEELMKEETGETPLQIQLSAVADKIGELGLMAAIFIGLVLIAKDVIFNYQNGNGFFGTYLIDSFVNAFIICITVIVVAIPEGLPMAVTISLAYSVFQMKEEHNLVKHLEASETMGNVNNICTDKTGTLTKGVMEVRNFFLENKDFSKEGNVPKETYGLLVEAIANNITAYADKIDGKFVAKGNPTESALLQLLINRGDDYSSFKKPYVKKLPFSSVYKFMVTIVQLDEKNFRLYIKGAPEKVLNFCSKIRAENGKIDEAAKHKQTISEQQEKYASKCYRTIAVGYKDFTADPQDFQGEGKEGFDFFESYLSDITLLCLFGIADAPRDEVFASIKSCHDAGIMVRMVTGDNVNTAISIAQDVGIISVREGSEARNRIKREANQASKEVFKTSETYIALEGNEFRELSGGYVKIEDGKDQNGNPKYKFELKSVDKFRKTTENLKVIARASPDDKFLLVLGLKQLDNIVAVTGDGTNDAPAMKKADVGFAMGIRGTDIAKAASDIVLLNDSFASIVTATKYGRNVYDCIRKFLQFQLTCNIVAVFMTLLGGVILNDSPLNSIQMLWVNLIMDSFASLALATEPPSDRLLQRKPYSKNTSIITSSMKINIGAQSAFQIIVLIIIIFYGDIIFDVPSDRELNHYTWNDKVGYHFTIFFHIFVLLQVFNSINARKLLRSEINIFENIFNNWLYLFIQAIILAGQIVMVTFGGRALRTHPLTLNQHLGCIGIASISLIVGVLIKLLPLGLDEETKESGRPTFSIAKSIRGKNSDIYSIRTKKSIKI